MTIPGLPEVFSRVLSDPEWTPEILAARSERLRAMQLEIAKVLEAEYEGSDASGRLTVLVTAVGRLRSVYVDGSLTLRPSSTGLAEAFTEALRAASEKAAALTRDRLRSEFGISSPAPEDAVKAATQSRHSIEEQIATIQDPAVAAALRSFIRRVEDFTTELFMGACGPVELSLSAAGALKSVSLDRVALQGVDNVTLAEAFLGAWDSAFEQLESARQTMATQELDLDITPAQAKAQSEAAIAHAEAILREVREFRFPRA